MQNLALICAQKNSSVFFNQLVKANIEKLDDRMEVRDFIFLCLIIPMQPSRLMLLIQIISFSRFEE